MKGKIGLNQLKALITVVVYLMTVPLQADDDAQGGGFVKKIRGAGQVHAAVKTVDGRFVSLHESDNASCLIRKISEHGKTIWEKKLSFQIAADGYVFMRGIAETNSGYVLVGSGPLGGYYDESTGVIVNLKGDGSIQRAQTFKSLNTHLSFDSAFSTGDGGYIVRGSSFQFPSQSSLTILVKFSSNGNVLWSKSFSDFNNSHAQSVSDGLILVDERSDGLPIVKIDDSGRIVWNKTLKIAGFHLHTLGPGSGNGVTVAGESLNSNKLIVIGLNATGDFQWKAGYSLKVPSFYINSLAQTSDGGYVVTGKKFNPKTGGKRSGIILAIDASQNLLFQRKFGFIDKSEEGESVFATSAGNFMVFASSGGHDTLLLNLNSESVIPGCKFLNQLSVKKADAPDVTSQIFEIPVQDYRLPAEETIEVSSVATEIPVSNTCP